MKLALFIDTMGVGGAQRVLALLANRWAEHGAEVWIATLSDPSEDRHDLHPAITRRWIGHLGPASNRLSAMALNTGRVLRIRRHLRDMPDVAVSFMQRMNVLVLAASVRTQVPVIVSERVDPRMHPTHPLTRLAARRLYRRAAAVVVQTADVAGWARALSAPNRIFVIPNPVPSELLEAERGEPTFEIVAAGRLVRQKGFDILVDAFARLDHGWRLTIYGDGPERQSLEARIHELQLGGRATLPGTYRSPVEALAHAGIFCLPSRYEGFPNVLLEAMALGVPVVATNCRSGPSDLIEDGINGVLVPSEDVEALATGLRSMVADPELRDRLARAARSSAAEYSTELVGRRWDPVLTGVIQSPGRP